VALKHGRLAVLLLLPAGVLAGHAMGYAGAGHAHGAAASPHVHGYLASAATVAVPLAVLALLWAVARPAAAAGVSFPRMLALQWVALLFQEAVEHLVAGQPVAALLGSRPLWLGLAAQLAVAGGAILLLRSARAVGARLASLPARVHVLLGSAGTAVTATLAGAPRSRRWRAVPARAPPLPAR
jgi:hypothetical protein